jgi:hypothetical protein
MYLLSSLYRTVLQLDNSITNMTCKDYKHCFLTNMNFTFKLIETLYYKNSYLLNGSMEAYYACVYYLPAS